MKSSTVASKIGLCLRLPPCVVYIYIYGIIVSHADTVSPAFNAACFKPRNDAKPIEVPGLWHPTCGVLQLVGTVAKAMTYSVLRSSITFFCFFACRCTEISG